MGSAPIRVGIDSHGAEADGEGNATYTRNLIAALYAEPGDDASRSSRADPRHPFYGGLPPRPGRGPSACGRGPACSASRSRSGAPPRGQRVDCLHVQYAAPLGWRGSARRHRPRPRLPSRAGVVSRRPPPRPARARAAEHRARLASHHVLRVLSAATSRRATAWRPARLPSFRWPRRRGFPLATAGGDSGRARALRARARASCSRWAGSTGERTSSGCSSRYGRLRAAGVSDVPLVIGGKPDYGVDDVLRRAKLVPARLERSASWDDPRRGSAALLRRGRVLRVPVALRGLWAAVDRGDGVRHARGELGPHGACPSWSMRPGCSSIPRTSTPSPTAMARLLTTPLAARPRPAGPRAEPPLLLGRDRPPHPLRLPRSGPSTAVGSAGLYVTMGACRETSRGFASPCSARAACPRATAASRRAPRSWARASPRAGTRSPCTAACRTSRHPGREYRGMRLVKLPTIRQKHLDTIAHSFLSSLHALFRATTSRSTSTWARPGVLDPAARRDSGSS